MGKSFVTYTFALFTCVFGGRQSQENDVGKELNYIWKQDNKLKCVIFSKFYLFNFFNCKIFSFVFVEIHILDEANGYEKVIT